MLVPDVRVLGTHHCFSFDPTDASVDTLAPRLVGFFLVCTERTAQLHEDVTVLHQVHDQLGMVTVRVDWRDDVWM